MPGCRKIPRMHVLYRRRGIIETMTKQFVFLYPIPEIIDCETKQSAQRFRDRTEKEQKEFMLRLESAKSETERETIIQKALQTTVSRFREIYKVRLNACIDTRYRRNGFAINYAIFDGSSVSDLIELQKSDRVIEVGLDFKTHTTKMPDGECPYPDQDDILNLLDGVRILRIGGFHMWDCVERLARRAYERGVDVMVDEDLTEFLGIRLSDPDFRIDRYPTYKPRGDPYFMEARRGKPWLWQNYDSQAVV